MANNTISQIKLGTTTYDICDYTFRTKMTWWKKLDRTVSSAVSVNANYLKDFSWSNSVPSNYTYWGYLQYNTASVHLAVATLTEGGMALINRSTSTISVFPTATMLYTTSLLDS